MAKKQLVCSGCYRPIKGEHFTVPAAGNQTMAFHKDAHACAAATDVKEASNFSQKKTQSGKDFIRTQIKSGTSEQ